MSNVKKLYLSNEDKMLGGVCGGIAEYFSIDATLIRLGFIVLCFISAGTALIAYPIMYIVIPKKPEKTKKVEDTKETK